MTKLIVCPNDVKIKILEDNSKKNDLVNIKFMTKKEFIDNYYFSYDDKTLYYLMDKYHFNLDVCRVYLSNLYGIDVEEDYSNNKLIFLRDLKKELIENNLLYFNPAFKEYLKDKEIEVVNYFDLDKYEEEALNTKVDVPSCTLDTVVVKCETLEEEVNDVCLKIIDLINNGIDINKIYLANVQEEYLYTIKKLFGYYNIPINLDMGNSIYSTKVVKDYLIDGTLDLENTDNISITRSLVRILGDLSDIPEGEIYRTLLIDKLKKSKISSKKLKNAVNVKDLNNSLFNDDDHVFVLSFNQDILPKMAKDIEYINDEIRPLVNMYTSNEINIRTKAVLKYLLSRIKNLHLSYKKASAFNSYYKSSLINDLKLEEVKPIEDKFSYSDIYNKLRLGEKLDLFNLYGEEDEVLKVLNKNYSIDYKTYDNSFTGIDNNIYLDFISKPLNISYSSMNYYNECSFKYYLSNVLRLDTFEERFAQFVGNLYHRILDLFLEVGDRFDLEKEWDYYLENTEYKLDIKDRIFLIKIKKDLIELIESLKGQQLLTGYDNFYLEKKIEIELTDKKVKTIFKGFIDKIMYLEKFGNTYYSIIDYKTGSIDTKIEPMKYGLHMQLPVYMYLIKYGRLFENGIFTGIYYQNILFNYPSCNSIEELEKIKRDRMKLQGYSIDDTEILERFDTTFMDSSYIKSMKYNEEKGFGTYSKVISAETVDNMIEYTKDKIDEVSNNILDSKFDINPKFYDKENISCKFCSFQDICYMRDSNLKYLSKVENLDFLGGEE